MVISAGAREQKVEHELKHVRRGARVGSDDPYDSRASDRDRSSFGRSRRYFGAASMTLCGAIVGMILVSL
jgi:hypothetical protein